MGIVNRIRRKLFGEILVSDGLITKEQLDEALELQKASGDFLGSILLDLGHITETDIVKTLSVQYQLPFLRPSLYDLDRKLLALFKPEFLHLHKLLPLDKIGNLLLLVVTDIPTEDVVQEVQEVVQSNLAIYIGSISEVDQVLKQVAPLDGEGEAVIRRHRKVSTKQAAKQTAKQSSDVQDLEKEVVLTLDTSWESIFDEAEGNVKGGDDSDGDTDSDN
jgi:type IV pilus assembly protein PilB